jgi:hypothetical protein
MQTISVPTEKGKTMAERCVCCGEIIPEGRQVCPNCENAPLREKLVELVHDGEQQCSKISCKGCEHFVQLAKCKAYIIADHLIANGVRLEEKQATSNASEQFARDNNVPSKCDYCQEDREGYRKALGSFFLANPFHGSVWQIKTKRTKPRQIFFCPMCGRKLAEPPKGE